MRRYRIQDDGYTGFKHIYRDRERRPCGRVVRNADGNFTASVGKVSETGETEKDAFLQVWATVEGLDLSELHRALAPQTKTQPYTETVLDWLKVNAAENGGHPRSRPRSRKAKTESDVGESHLATRLRMLLRRPAVDWSRRRQAVSPCVGR
jgi:hypothetical protein